ncbi:MAG: hypothetical protein R3E77_05975 [Steroidobacteraceae bacterium]
MADSDKPPIRRVVYLVQPDTVTNAHELFGEFLSIVSEKRIHCALIVILATSIGILYSLVAPVMYRSELTLLPNESQGGVQIGGQLGELGGLASLAGLKLGSTRSEEPLAVLRSRGFAARFIESRSLVEPINTAANWFPHFWSRRQPDIRDAVDEFTDNLVQIDVSTKTGLITVAVSWKDPIEAANWANGMARQINAEMRQRALDESTRNIGYLREKLKTETIVSLQQSMGRVLESELQKVMFAAGSDQYAYRIVDAAEIPKERSQPKRVLIALLSFLSGALGAFVWLLTQLTPRQRSQEEASL